MKILFVEDDDAIALGLIYSLEKEGYLITHYKTQKEAINALSEQIFDLLLLAMKSVDMRKVNRRCL